jgi:hypothetical protein
MNLLTATSEGQGDHPGDFCFAVEGELVLIGPVCATDEADPGGGCGCGRAFSGMGSRRATTTAVLRDLDLDEDDLRLAVQTYFIDTGMGPDVLGDDFAALVDETVEESLLIGRSCEPGTVVRRRLNRLLRV